MRMVERFRQMRDKLFALKALPSHSGATLSRRPAWLFAMFVLLYVAAQLTMQPTWMLGGEMWAEMATNYYPYADSPSIWQQLFSTDAGYIPLPQRLLAFLGNQFGFFAAWIPYFYTWSAVLLSAMLVGVFCLAPFRKLVSSDLLRFFSAFSVLAVADFETKNFINFSYFAAFFVALVTALALVDGSEESPWWAWFVPIFMLSKPALLATLPAMVVVAVFSRSRFRAVAIAALLVGLIQCLQMFVSSKTGAMPFRENDIALGVKLLASIKYFLGFLGGFAIGPVVVLKKPMFMLVGLIILSVSVYLIIFRRCAANALIFVGLCLSFFNFFINAFALSDSWTVNAAKLSGVPVYRHTIVGFFGTILLICGLICHLGRTLEMGWKIRFSNELMALLFLVWFGLTGWWGFALRASNEPLPPTIGNSQWQALAFAIDDGTTPLCVPINPWWKNANWMYQRGCRSLNMPPAWEDGQLRVNKRLFFIGRPSSLRSGNNLVAAAVLVKPVQAGTHLVKVELRVESMNGNIDYLSGSRNVGEHGALIMLTGKNVVNIGDIRKVDIGFDIPVDVARGVEDPIDFPGIAWMGN